MEGFRVSCEMANVVDRRRSAAFELPVDAGSLLTWAPEELLEQIGVRPVKERVVFVRRSGDLINRRIGFAVIRHGEHHTVDEVVFAEPGDLPVIGARTLDGMRLSVDPAPKRLTPAGPSPVASA